MLNGMKFNLKRSAFPEKMSIARRATCENFCYMLGN
jgi:hypothetical protein